MAHRLPPAYRTSGCAQWKPDTWLAGSSTWSEEGEWQRQTEGNGWEAMPSGANYGRDSEGGVVLTAMRQVALSLLGDGSGGCVQGEDGNDQLYASRTSTGSSPCHSAPARTVREAVHRAALHTRPAAPRPCLAPCAPCIHPTHSNYPQQPALIALCPGRT